MAMSWIVSIFSCNKLSSFHQSLNKAEQMVHFFCTEGNNKFSFQNRKLQSLFSAESAICLLHFGKLLLCNPGFRHKFMFHKSLNSTSHGGIERRWKFTSSIWFWKTPFFLRLKMLVMSTHLKLGHLSQELVYMGQSENTGDCWYQFWIHFFDCDHNLVFDLVDTWTSGPWGTNHSHRGRPVAAFPHSQSETRMNSIFLIWGKFDQTFTRYINVGHVSFSWPTIVLLKCLFGLSATACWTLGNLVLSELFAPNGKC